MHTQRIAGICVADPDLYAGFNFSEHPKSRLLPAAEWADALADATKAMVQSVRLRGDLSL